MYLLLILTIIIIILIIGLYCLYYFEIPRYRRLNYSTWSDVIKLDKNYANIPRVNSKNRIVISMTSIPSRLDKIAPTLCSILTQTRRVDEIRLNIPYISMKGDKYIIPKCFKHFKNIKIHRPEKDFGPSTKLLPTLKDEYNSNIIVIDDDMIYGSNLVYSLVEAFNKHNQEIVITTYGCNKLDNKISRIHKFLSGNKYVYLLFGCGGYILRGNMLPNEVFEYENAPEEAKYVDDNWISGWLWMNDVNVYTLGLQKGMIYIPSYETAGTISLCNGVNHNKHNNRVVDKWFEQKKLKQIKSKK